MTPDQSAVISRLRELLEEVARLIELQREACPDDEGEHQRNTGLSDAAVIVREALEQPTVEALLANFRPAVGVGIEGLCKRIFLHAHSDGWTGNQRRRDTQMVDAEKSWGFYVSDGALAKSLVALIDAPAVPHPDDTFVDTIEQAIDDFTRGEHGPYDTMAEFVGRRLHALAPANEAQGGEEGAGWREAARQEELAKVYRRAQLTAEEKLCREEANSAGWKGRCKYLEEQLALRGGQA